MILSCIRSSLGLSLSQAPRVTVKDALQDVMKLAKKLKKSGADKAQKRAAAAGDDERLKSIAAQFENDPDLKEAAARVQV